MIALLLAALALAGPFADVRRPLGGGASVNWTRLRLELAVAEADPTLALDARPLEMRAIRRIDDEIARALEAVPLRPGVRLGEGADVAASRIRRSWHVAESRYFDSGRIEVVGAVDLQDVLAPWSTARSVVLPAALPSDPTGVVIDVRGLPLLPSYAPQVVDEAGELLYDAVVWKHLAFQTPPAVWVSDPAAPEAGVAGARAWLAVAAAAREGVVVLAAADAARWRAEVAPAVAHGAGSIVLVVDAQP
ncbi:MAG: hypothetical protein H6732_15560 [Alphaproteobacteria bacterium]|nr:hypothetical protein [Alphaproteobacteria bacterium]